MALNYGLEFLSFRVHPILYWATTYPLLNTGWYLSLLSVMTAISNIRVQNTVLGSLPWVLWSICESGVAGLCGSDFFTFLPDTHKGLKASTSSPTFAVFWSWCCFEFLFDAAGFFFDIVCNNHPNWCEVMFPCVFIFSSLIIYDISMSFKVLLNHPYFLVCQFMNWAVWWFIIKLQKMFNSSQ